MLSPHLGPCYQPTLGDNRTTSVVNALITVVTCVSIIIIGECSNNRRRRGGGGGGRRRGGGGEGGEKYVKKHPLKCFMNLKIIIIIIISRYNSIVIALPQDSNGNHPRDNLHGMSKHSFWENTKIKKYLQNVIY